MNMQECGSCIVGVERQGKVLEEKGKKTYAKKPAQLPGVGG